VAKLAPTQIEQLQNIGAYLSQVRQQQGLALDVLANQIFIRPALLHALESGQGAELPEPVFIQGFIRRYAEALGLDGQAISHEFQVTPMEVLPTPDPLTRADGNGAVETTLPPSVAVPKQVLPTPVRRSDRNLPLSLLLSLGALATVLGLGIWGVLGRSNGPTQANNTAPVAETTPIPVAPEDPIAEEPLAEESSDAPEAGLSKPLEAPVVVSVNLSDRAWLSVVADGKNVYEGTAESGFEETWTAQKSLVFRTGNAGGVELSVNGDRAVVVGEPGVVKTLTLTPDSDVKSVQSP
jgi:cytoskeletal protein RodZ